MLNQETKFKETEIGLIPEDWEVKKIEDLFKISAGGDLAKISYSKSNDAEFKFPIFSNTLINKGLHGFSKGYQYEPECVTITARGDVGKAECRKEPFNAIVRLLVLKPKADVSCSFVADYINNSLDFEHVGSAVNQLTAPMISKVTIAYPPINEQKKIAEVLGVLNEKIELNRKMNKTLEEIGQTIFREWFLINPEREYWESVSIDELSEVKYGNLLPKTEMTEIGFPVYGANGKIGFTEKMNQARPRLITGCRGVVGSVFITEKECYVTNNSLIVNEKSPEFFGYLYFSLKNYDIKNSIASGSAQPQVTLANISKLFLKNPPKELLVEFNKIFMSLLSKIELNNSEITTLSETRDSLLPKLMSGKVRVV